MKFLIMHVGVKESDSPTQIKNMLTQMSQDMRKATEGIYRSIISFPVRGETGVRFEVLTKDEVLELPGHDAEKLRELIS